MAAKSRVLILILALGAALGAALGLAPESFAKDLAIGTSNPAAVLDPADNYGGWYSVRYGAAETPLKLDDSMRPAPWLATSWKMVDDKTWVIAFRDGVVFHSGRPMTGEAVKKSLERVIGLNKRAETSLGISEIIANGLELTIKTSEPNPILPNFLCEPFSSIVDVEEQMEPGFFSGTGPYKVKSFKPNEETTLVRHDAYWGGRPKLDSVSYKDIPDGGTLTMALQSGEIDASDRIPYFNLHLFDGNPAYKIQLLPTSRAYMVFFNLEKPFTAVKEVREAVNLAIDKKSYSEILLNRAGTPAIGPFPAYLPYGGDKVKALGFDVAAAAKALADAGFKDADGDGILDKDGRKLSLSLVTYPSRVDLPTLGEAIQGQLRELGVEVKMEVVEGFEEIFERGDFDLAIYSGVTTPIGDPYSFLAQIAGSQGGTNYGRFKSPEVDSLLDKLKGEFDEGKRADLAVSISQAMLDSAAYSFMVHINTSFVMKSSVTDLRQHPTDYYQITAETDIAE